MRLAHALLAVVWLVCIAGRALHDGRGRVSSAAGAPVRWHIRWAIDAEPAEVRNQEWLETADVDGDGDLDIVDRDRWFENTGCGTCVWPWHPWGQ